MIRKIVFAAALAGMAMSQSAMAEMKKIRIGVEAAYPPFAEKNAEGEMIGFDLDIAKAMCAAMKAECVFVEQDWDGIIPGLLARKYDAIISSMTITEERRKRIDFSKKYYHDPAKFVSREGAFADDSPAALAGKTIGVQRGTTHDNYLTALYKDSDIKRYATQDDVYLDLLAGRLDASLANSVALAEGFLKTDDGKGFAFFGKSHADPRHYGEGAGVAVRKGEEDLRDAFTKAISDIRADGTYARINDKYFAIDIYGE